MPSDTRPNSSQLFQFTVPGLPDLWFAITMQEVLEVTDLTGIAPIPFAPQFVMGLSKWRDHIVTVVDLAIKLGDPVPSRQSTLPLSHYLIAQVVLNEQLNVVAWPILPQSGAIVVPPRAFRAESPPGLFMPMVHTTIMLADQPITLLNLEKAV
jgi:chemotaxis signal transduction protein